MKRFEDENNPYGDGDAENDGDEFSGFTVTDDTGAEISRPEKKKAGEENYDDGETVEASPIPENELIFMIDNASVSGLQAGAPLLLKIDGETAAAVYDNDQKIGDLKPAFVKKLLETRKGFWAESFLYSALPPVMVKIRFYDRSRKNTVKI